MRMIFLSIIFILGCSVCSAPAGNHVFLCRKCSVIAIKNTRPNMSNCSSAGSHQWTDLGLEGEKIYLCQKMSENCKNELKTQHIKLSGIRKSYLELLGAVRTCPISMPKMQNQGFYR